MAEFREVEVFDSIALALTLIRMDCVPVYYVPVNTHMSTSDLLYIMHVIKIENRSNCSVELRDSYDILACLLDRASVVEKFISSNVEKTVEESWRRQREQKKGRQEERKTTK